MIPHGERGGVLDTQKGLGVNMVTVCSSLIGLAARYRLHQACKAKYHNFVLNTRCVVFCLKDKSNESVRTTGV